MVEQKSKMEVKQKGKDLTKSAPRSPKEKIVGFSILARTLDKCRATLWGNVGEYHFDCPLDNQLFSFKGIKGSEFKKVVEKGLSDIEVAKWLATVGTPRTEAEIKAWSDMVTKNNYSDNADKKAWLEGENIKAGLDKDATLFDYLDADDRLSFKK